MRRNDAWSDDDERHDASGRNLKLKPRPNNMPARGFT